jgi:hypothetical protein
VNAKVYCIDFNMLGRLQAALRLAEFEAKTMVGRGPVAAAKNAEAVAKLCGEAARDLDALPPAAHATAAALSFNTGGGDLVDRLTLDDGKILEISEDCVVMFPGELALHADPEEVQEFPGFTRALDDEPREPR